MEKKIVTIHAKINAKALVEAEARYYKESIRYWGKGLIHAMTWMDGCYQIELNK